MRHSFAPKALLLAAGLSCGGLAEDCPGGTCPGDSVLEDNALGDALSESKNDTTAMSPDVPPGQQEMSPAVETSDLPTPSTSEPQAAQPDLHLCTEDVQFTIPLDDSEPPRRQLEVFTQEGVEALRNCEAIVGDLSLLAFEGADLSPLSRLKSVSGELGIGNPYYGISWELPQEEWARMASLAGLEALVEVGSLLLGPQLDVPDLQALRNLKSYHSLTLRGLSQLTRVDALPRQDSLRRLAILDTPLLTSIVAIVPLEVTEEFSLARTAISNLEGFENVRRINSVSLSENPELKNLAELHGLENLNHLYVRSNSGLVDSGVYPNVSRLESLTIVGNEQLLRAPQFPRIQRLSEGGTFRIDSNASLSEITGFPLLESAGRLCIQFNPLLDKLELPELQRVDTVLSIMNNGALSDSTLGGMGLVPVPESFLGQNDRLSPTGLDLCFGLFKKN